MTETAALLADEVLPRKPLRQWVLSLPFALRFLLATESQALTEVLGIVYRAISGYILQKARLTRAGGGDRLATLVPAPRVRLTRYHGVFAPASAWRSRRRVVAEVRGPKKADRRNLSHE